MTLIELRNHCLAQIKLQADYGKQSPEVLLVVSGSPYRQTAASGRRRMRRGGPIGEIVSSVETHDNVMFDAKMVLAWCERKLMEQADG